MELPIHTKMDTFDAYMMQARKTATWNEEQARSPWEYCILGLCEEVSEIAEKFRGDEVGSTYFTDAAIAALPLELGDVLWYLTNIAFELGFSLRTIAEYGVQPGIPVYLFEDYDYKTRVCMPSWERLILDLCVDTGKVAGLIKKSKRGDKSISDPEIREQLKCRMCYVLTSLSAAAAKLDLTLQIIAELNITKIRDRQARNVLKGSGDNR